MFQIYSIHTLFVPPYCLLAVFVGVIFGIIFCTSKEVSSMDCCMGKEYRKLSEQLSSTVTFNITPRKSLTPLQAFKCNIRHLSGYLSVHFLIFLPVLIRLTFLMDAFVKKLGISLVAIKHTFGILPPTFLARKEGLLFKPYKQTT